MVNFYGIINPIKLIVKLQKKKENKNKKKENKETSQKSKVKTIQKKVQCRNDNTKSRLPT